MGKILSYAGRAISILIAIVVVIVIIAYFNHQNQLSKEDEFLIPPGELVEVNGNDMHVYTEGAGDKTLVFMAGGGTSSPYLDFKTLYDLLSDQYKIVVIEKAGYGFSEITSTPRNIETILSETREALAKAEVEGPYVLFPHSMSGIEALYWAQNYPDEVSAIIGLDMAVPEAYEDYKISMPLVRLGELTAKTGVIRWLPFAAESDAIKYGTLTDEEKELYEAIFYRRTVTTNMTNEVNEIKENAQKVAEQDIPNIPMLLFSSNGEGTGLDETAWTGLQRDFIEQQQNGVLIQFDASHYIHNIEQEAIAEESMTFLEDL